MEEYKIHIPRERFDELKQKIDSARFPSYTNIDYCRQSINSKQQDTNPNQLGADRGQMNKNCWQMDTDRGLQGIDCSRRVTDSWQLGTPTNALLPILNRWIDGYRWDIRERELNAYAQYLWDVEDMRIHLFHIRSKREGAPAILMTHGWPDGFLRYTQTFDLLQDYHLVVPSMPGFGFSTLPSKGFINNAEVADLWHRLMTKELGYTAYAVTGGDMGRGVACYLATRYPDAVRGIHLTDVGLVKDLLVQSDSLLSDEEKEYKHRAQTWLRREGAYINIQSTKPATLGFALSDSPVALAAWLLEKYHDWSDWARLSIDDFLDNLTLYWMTNSAASSIRAYHGNAFTLPPMTDVKVPTAIAAFPHDILPAPRSWIEKHYPVVQFTEMQHGGHFTAMEEPRAFAEDLSRFLRKIQR